MKMEKGDINETLSEYHFLNLMEWIDKEVPIKDRERVIYVQGVIEGLKQALYFLEKLKEEA